MVDNMLILGNNDHLIKSTKKILINKFNIKDLGIIDVIVNVILEYDI